MRIWFWPRDLAAGSSATRTAPDSRARSRFFDALHIFVLVNFAVAQPVYDRLSERAALFVDQVIGMPVAYVLAALLSLGLPAAIVWLEWLVGRCGPRCYEALHRVVIWGFLFLIALPVCKYLTFFEPYLIIVCSAVGAIVGMGLYVKFRPARTILTVAAPGIVLFPAIFLVQFSTNFVKLGPASYPTDRWDPVPVVVLVFDEFCGSSLMTPERNIDAHRFPNFAALARDSTWFRNATSVNGATMQALPSILSGRYAATTYVPVVANLPQNLFSVLTAAGYERAVFEPVSALAAPGVEMNANQSRGLWTQTVFVGNFLWRVYLFHIAPVEYQPYLPEIPRLWWGMHESRMVKATPSRGVFRYSWSETRDLQFQHFLNCLDGSQKPALYFMHVLLPHMPWCYLPSGSRYTVDGEDWQLQELNLHLGLPGSWGTDELELINNQQRYLLQLQYVDRLVGKCIARLKEQGLYDRCLLVVTGDHGISFRASQSRRLIGKENLDEILSIPLFIKRPGQTVGGVSEQHVESVDIFPTVADVLGLGLGRPTDGWSVFDTSRSQRTQKTFGNFGERQTIDPAVVMNSTVPLTIRERFGDSSDPDSLYQISQIPELIGRRVDSLRQASGSPIKMEFLRYGDEVIAGQAPSVPCFFEGRLGSQRTSAAPSKIAVAVNGTIHAVTRTYRQPGLPSSQWAAMVPESAFHAGRNDVRCYQVTGTQPDWVLTPYVAVPAARK